MTSSYAEFRPTRFAFAPLIGIASRLAALGGYPRNTRDGKRASVEHIACRRRLSAICVLMLALSAVGDCYTNLAGKAIAATPVKVEGGKVTFRKELGNRKEELGRTDVKMPLSIFPAGEQKRIKAAVGIREMPGELKELAAEIASQRARYEARAKAGKLSQEKLAENLEMLDGSWRHAVEETNLSQEEKAYWKGAF